MEERVNDFLNEINEIRPLAKNKQQVANECVWQECFDDNSGFPYYWNVQTNEVTWEMPESLNTPKIAIPKSGVQAKPLFPTVADVATTCTTGNSRIEGSSLSVSREISKLATGTSQHVDSDPESLEANGSHTNSPRLENAHSSDTEGAEDVIPTLGFSLLANYGTGSDEETEDDEDDEKKSKSTQILSTLFPATEPIDVTQFQEEKVVQIERQTDAEVIDAKAFKRKRRIGVHLDNRPKIQVATASTESNEPQTAEEEQVNDKGDTLPSSSDQNKPCDSPQKEENPTIGYGDSIDPDLSEKQGILKEKLTFLSVGRDDVGPVQIMLIQLETLFEAWHAGDLKSSYLTTWISSTCSDLIELEAAATPEGWTLEWDRKEKRYCYRNKKSNDCQWEYPEGKHAAQDTNDDDAMDICTTPPPPSNVSHSGDGIEVVSITACESNTKNAPNKLSMDINSALDSFYSDIAAIETAANNVPQENVQNCGRMPNLTYDHMNETSAVDAACQEPVKKKKKVKMSHGIAMKKKGVSQLVEKWKNMQKDLE